MEGSLAAYFQLQNNSLQHDRGYAASSGTHEIEHFPAEEEQGEEEGEGSICSDYSDDDNFSLPPLLLTLPPIQISLMLQ